MPPLALWLYVVALIAALTAATWAAIVISVCALILHALDNGLLES